MNRALPVLAIAAALMGCEKPRTPCVYEIPEGFTGWVLIDYGRSDCPPIAVKDGRLVFRLGKDGRFCTSSTLQLGVAKDEYYYVGNSRRELPVTGWGGGGLIWGGSTGSVQTPGLKEKTYENFFVGTEQQFKQAPDMPRP